MAKKKAKVTESNLKYGDDLTIDEERKKELANKIRDLLRDRFNDDPRAAFTYYDDDSDEKLTSANLYKILTDASVGNYFTRNFWVQGVLTAADKDQDGLISWQELQDVIKMNKV